MRVEIAQGFLDGAEAGVTGAQFELVEVLASRAQREDPEGVHAWAREMLHARDEFERSRPRASERSSVGE